MIRNNNYFSEERRISDTLLRLQRDAYVYLVEKSLLCSQFFNENMSNNLRVFSSFPVSS